MTPRKPPESLEAFADRQAQAQHAENAEIARKNRALSRELAEAQKTLAEVSARLDLYERLDAVKASPPTWLTPKTTKKEHVAIPSLVVGDVHWDEVTKPEQIGWINAYNRKIAIMRTRRAFEGAVKLSREYLSGVTYDGFNLFLPGDFFSGVIHEELRETNEASIMESVISLIEVLEAGIDLLAREFGRVHVSCVVGNHGRNTKKPRAKNRPQDNFDWLLYKLIERDFKGRADITMQVADGADTIVPVYGVKYLLTHGDQFHGGSGISGLLAPLLLGSHRKTRRQAAAGQPYDIMVMGHWHQSLFFPAKGLIVSGCVKGYDEFAYLNNFEPEPPQCAFWLTTPERGVTVSSPVFVSKRDEEGW